MVFLSKLHTEKLSWDFGGEVAQFSTEYLEVTRGTALIRKTVVEETQFH